MPLPSVRTGEGNMFQVPQLIHVCMILACLLVLRLSSKACALDYTHMFTEPCPMLAFGRMHDLGPNAWYQLMQSCASWEQQGRNCGATSNQPQT